MIKKLNSSIFYSQDRVITCKLTAMLARKGVSYYQTVSADWITGAGMSVTVTTGAGAKIGAARDALETRGAHLAGQA